MSKEEIKNLLIDFVCEYDFTNWSNDKVYEKFSDLIYKQISDLEAKLAESEERVKDLEFRNKNLEHSLKVAPNANAGQRARIVELKEINHKLKQQLAEKAQAIEEINKEFVQAVKDWKSLVEQKNRDIAELEEHDRVYHNQLAIAELEKVQSGLYSIPTPYDMITSLPISGNTFSNGFHKGMYKVIELIDNQIKQLKEGK